MITQGEKYNKVVDIWAKATDDVANEMMEVMKLAPVPATDGKPMLDDKGKPVIEESFNPIYMMADSGRSRQQGPDAPAGRYARPDGQALR